LARAKGWCTARELLNVETQILAAGASAGVFIERQHRKDETSRPHGLPGWLVVKVVFRGCSPEAAAALR
jgi:hypothetical protein